MTAIGVISILILCIALLLLIKASNRHAEEAPIREEEARLRRLGAHTAVQRAVLKDLEQRMSEIESFPRWIAIAMTGFSAEYDKRIDAIEAEIRENQFAPQLIPDFRRRLYEKCMKYRCYRTAALFAKSHPF